MAFMEDTVSTVNIPSGPRPPNLERWIYPIVSTNLTLVAYWVKVRVVSVSLVQVYPQPVYPYRFLGAEKEAYAKYVQLLSRLTRKCGTAVSTNGDLHG